MWKASFIHMIIGGLLPLLCLGLVFGYFERAALLSTNRQLLTICGVLLLILLDYMFTRMSSCVLRQIDWKKNVKGALILLSASELGIVVYGIVVWTTWLLETRVSELQNQQSVSVGLAEPLRVVIVILLPFVLASALVFYKLPRKS
jgi:hypothetical protein